MSFFYELNQRMAKLAEKQDAMQTAEQVKATAPRSQLAESLDVAEAGYSAKKAAAGKDIGQPGKNFAKIAKSAGARYGSQAAGERVAGAVLNKLRHPKEDQEMEESALQAYLGNKKYGKEGMDALRKAGREHAGKAKMDQIRNRYDKMDEADMEEGNAFSKAVVDAKKDGIQPGEKIKVGGKTYPVKEADVTGLGEEEMDEGFKEMDAWLASREKAKGTGKFDKKKTSTGTVYTRKPETFDDPETDPEATGGAPKRVGRPKSAKPKDTERVTRGSHKYKMHAGKRVKKDKEAHGKMHEDGIPITDRGEYDDEAGMTKDSLHTIVRSAKELERALQANENLPEWVQEKIGQIKGMMSSVTDYIISTHERDVEQHMEPMAEKSVSKAQRKFMGMAHAMQKGEKIKGASPELKKVAKTMKPSDTHDFAATKEKELPNKVKKTEEAAKPDFLDVDKDGNKKETFKKAVADKKDKKVDETTTSGSVATAPAAAKNTKGMQFGKGVYESINTRVESMITESMNITVNMSTDEHGEPHKSVTVTADGDDADKLAELLKMAGLGGQSHAATCDACGQTPCGCAEVVDENSPDWPTDTETLAAQPELRTYSGGLNGPKSTGQTTIPVIAGQLRRQTSMEENVELERSLFKTWKNYKG
jgi:hypothetical protein